MKIEIFYLLYFDPVIITGFSLQNTSPKEKFRQVLAQSREAVAEELKLTEEIMIRVAQNAPGDLRGRLEKIMSRQGKRVRATMVFLLRNTSAKPISLDRAAHVAASIEMLHLASLVHDDVIDSSELRRGETTAHADWGNKMAVLVGDYVLSKSMELVVSDEESRFAEILSRASSRLVEGEVLELDMVNNPDASYKDYLEVIDGKTASLLQACGECGALLAGLGAEQVNAAAFVGRDFGLAFQIVDDLLDYGFGASDLGKATFSDLNNKLMTLPMLYHFDTLDKAGIAAMQEKISRLDEPGMREEIFAALQESGAFTRTLIKAMEYLKEAQDMLHKLPISDGRNQLENICATMAFRAN